MPKPNTTARDWLVANGYDDIAGLIDRAMERWKQKGTRTRRDWWEVLAGRADGTGKIIEGIQFPVIAAIQRRMGRIVTEGSLCRNKKEVAPKIRPQGRWIGKGKP
jgi:hypothetical protein